MKYFLLIGCLALIVNINAQQKQVYQKDAPFTKFIVKDNKLTNKNSARLPVKTIIENGIINIVGLYTNQPNTEATWVKIRMAVEDYLYPFYKNGDLLGSKKEQAYFIKMGLETMTAADISNKKMILIAGIANIRPAEFQIITVTKNCN